MFMFIMDVVSDTRMHTCHHFSFFKLTFFELSNPGSPKQNFSSITEAVLQILCCFCHSFNSAKILKGEDTILYLHYIGYVGTGNSLHAHVFLP